MASIFAAAGIGSPTPTMTLRYGRSPGGVANAELEAVMPSTQLLCVTLFLQRDYFAGSSSALATPRGAGG